MWSIIILCSVILIGCETSGNSGAIPVIRPAKIDLNGVRGFAVVENSSNAPKTRADGDETDNENGETSYSHSLYTIDENGELHIAIFYFEVVASEGGDTEVMKEVSNALQVVPALVSDLGKYILFSGCGYEMNNNIIMSDEARAICESYVQNDIYHESTYLIRKSDGALFNVQGQSIFTYSFMMHYDDGNIFHSFTYNYFHDTKTFGWHIPTYKYMTSPKGNLFAQSPYNISKIVDNGDAIDVKVLTQEIKELSRFIVDANENIYICDREYYLDIYLSNGGFDAIDISYYLNGCRWTPSTFDMKVDNNNIPYLFLVKEEEKSEYNEYGELVTYATPCITAGILSDGKYIERNKIDIPSYTSEPYNSIMDPITYPHYIGYSNGDFKWFLSEDFFWYSEEDNNRKFKILTYNKDRDEWILEDIPEDLRNIFTEKYDFLLCGIKSYGVNVKGNTFEINEIDVANKSYRQYSFDVDVSYIKSQSHRAYITNGTPYLTIGGKSSENGADVSFTINLANGENNSTFASDNRNVVSFFRIN